MSFSAEVRDFIAAYHAGDELADRSRRAALQDKYYSAQANYYNSRAAVAGKPTGSKASDAAGADGAFQDGFDGAGAIPETAPAKPAPAAAAAPTNAQPVTDAGNPASGQGGDIDVSNDMDYLTGKGEDPQVAAALVGNAAQESSLNSQAVGDNGAAHGLYQFHQNGRLPAFQAWASQNKRDPGTNDAQHDFARYDLQTNFPDVYAGMKSAPNVDAATTLFAQKYERPRADSAGMERRLKYARAASEHHNKRSTTASKDGPAIPEG